MRRTRYLLAYDIRDPRRLRRVHKVATAFGTALQYSVFVCDLTVGELCDLRGALRDVMHFGEDSAMFVPLGDGYDASCFEFLGPAPSLPGGGSVIV
ncbi:MAG TPA: CRISPR-associated endonuclease Cas2 [Microthrixaceae bacterium]|nr:CRISPR-associated endonuclease Cas2 [Microthrixaceae bacterium]HNI33962.1 CRISPR-associated endonuclease Cas2 [Microthrixaceae bacterium]